MKEISSKKLIEIALVALTVLTVFTRMVSAEPGQIQGKVGVKWQRIYGKYMKGDNKYE